MHRSGLEDHSGQFQSKLLMFARYYHPAEVALASGRSLQCNPHPLSYPEACT
jgi:hypothetical protein